MSDVFFDSDRAFSRCRRLWRLLGGIYEKQAHEAAKKGLLDSSMKAARYAEVCFWQATGENDILTFGDVFPKEKGAE